MSNTISSLTAANTIDAVADYLAIDTASLGTTQKINRNTLLGISGNPVGTSDTQTLTNKTLTSPAISGPTLSGTITGTYTIGGTPTFPSSVVTLSGSQTLTNKTLTSPTINSPTISNATITADTINGYTTSTNGTLYGISITSSQIGTAAIASSAITASKIGTDSSFSWASWTPTWPNTTIGNGTVVAKYYQLGKTVHCYIKFTLGSTSSIGGTDTIFSLPVTSTTSGYSQFQPLNTCLLAGSSNYIGTVGWYSSTQGVFNTIDASATYAKGAIVNTTTPFTWASTNSMVGTFIYEAA